MHRIKHKSISSETKTGKQNTNWIKSFHQQSLKTCIFKANKFEGFSIDMPGAD